MRAVHWPLNVALVWASSAAAAPSRLPLLAHSLAGVVVVACLHGGIVVATGQHCRWYSRRCQVSLYRLNRCPPVPPAPRNVSVVAIKQTRNYTYIYIFININAHKYVLSDSSPRVSSSAICRSAISQPCSGTVYAVEVATICACNENANNISK